MVVVVEVGGNRWRGRLVDLLAWLVVGQELLLYDEWDNCGITVSQCLISWW